MLLSNNPELAADDLTTKLESVSTHRRRTKPLLTERQPQVVLPVEEAQDNPSDPGSDTARPGMRAFIKSIPGIGPGAVRLYRFSRWIYALDTQWKVRVRRIPILGSLAAWVHSIVHLNSVRQRLALELAEFRQNLQAFNRHVAQLDVINIANRLNRFDALDISSRLNAFDGTNIAHRLNRLESIDAGNRLDQLNAMMRSMLDRDAEWNRRFAALVREMHSNQKGMSVFAKFSPEDMPAAPAAGFDFDLDNFYVEFEDMFRGSSDDIRQRLTVYLPYLAGFAGDANARIVDIGCGRGEWLGLLAEHRIRATGIDLNNTMIHLCRERGFDAECTDAIAYLRQQPNGSLAAITGFHIIEHLPFETVIALFDAARDALRPDGVLIFETPNPENVVVGSCNFYYDPTHLHPIVPAVAEFIARQRGFAKAEILRVNAYPDSYLLPEESELARRFNRAFYGPQDYAVVAWKTDAH